MNIIGLAIGLAGSLAVLLWVFSETGYDSFHENGSRIQRVCRSRIRNGALTLAWCGYNFTDFDYDGKGADSKITSGVAWGDLNYVDVFGLEIIEGRNLSEEYSSDATDACLINEAAARAMGMENPVGQWVELEEERRRTLSEWLRTFTSGRYEVRLARL